MSPVLFLDNNLLQQTQKLFFKKVYRANVWECSGALSAPCPPSPGQLAL